MSNTLDPVWDAYNTARSAMGVVKRCLWLEGVARVKAFSNTRFYGVSDEQCLDLLDAAQTEIDDSAVLSLYATFEATLRDYVVLQGRHLLGARQPTPDFGVALAASFSAYCDGNRMDDLVNLFASAVGQPTVAQVGNIRTYRHWLAHGRRWDQPPAVTPSFAHQVLSSFLQAAGLS